MAFTYGDSVPEAGDFTPLCFIKASTIGDCGLPTKIATPYRDTFSTILNNFQEIGVMEKGHKLESKRTDSTQAADRSVFHNGRTVTFDATFLEITEDNLDYFITNYENIPCDVLFWDNRKSIDQGDPFVIAYGLRLVFEIIAINHDLIKVRIYGEAYEPKMHDVLVFDEVAGLSP